jgi:hypothetical protein
LNTGRLHWTSLKGNVPDSGERRVGLIEEWLWEMGMCQVTP